MVNFKYCFIKWNNYTSKNIFLALLLTHFFGGIPIDICKELGIKWYRCYPYSSREKWSVEVHNRYIRRYIPKWADINDYTDEYIEEITKKINNLPRKILWYRTSEEIFYGKTIKYF